MKTDMKNAFPECSIQFYCSRAEKGFVADIRFIWERNGLVRIPYRTVRQPDLFYCVFFTWKIEKEIGNVALNKVSTHPVKIKFVTLKLPFW